MDKLTLGTRKVSIEFPGVKALTNVDFEVSTGEIHALVGANGAGKSTLMKVLAGANPDYTGEVYLNGKPVELRSTMAAKKLGIQIVYQEVDMALVPTLSVAENVMLNDMVMSAGSNPLVNWPKLRTQAKAVLDRLNINVNVRTLVQDLSLAQKQMVLIARAIANESLTSRPLRLATRKPPSFSGWSSTFRKRRISPLFLFPTASTRSSRSVKATP